MFAKIIVSSICANLLRRPAEMVYRHMDDDLYNFLAKIGQDQIFRVLGSTFHHDEYYRQKLGLFLLRRF